MKKKGMVKRLISVSTFLFVLCFLASSISFAGGFQNDIYAKIERTNCEIEEMISEAQDDADNLILNSRLEGYRLEMEIQKIIFKLVTKVEQKSNAMIREAAMKGIYIEKEYRLVNIGGHNVLVDPLKVIGD
jgi:predicted PurR-regulated permease PerM